MRPALRAALVAIAAAGAIAWTPRTDVVRVQEAHPAIAGKWQLNENKSEKYDPQRDRDLSRPDATGATTKTGMGSRGGGSRGGGSSSGGGADAGGGFGGGGGGGADREAMRAMREATQQPRSLEIQQTDSTVTVGGRGASLMVYTDGRVIADSTLDGQVVKSVKASWKKDELTIERLVATGTTIKETYHLDKKDPKILLVDVRFESKPMRRTINNRRVYDLASTGG